AVAVPAPEPPPATPPASAPAVTSSPAGADVPSLPSPSRSALQGAVGLDALAAVGAAPSIAAGVDLWAAARLGMASIGLEGRIDSPATVTGTAGGQASMLLAGVSLVPCAHAGPFFACAVGGLAWVRAAGTDVAVRRAGSALAASVGPRAGIEVHLTRAL